MIANLNTVHRQVYKLDNGKFARMTIKPSADLGPDTCDFCGVYMGSNTTQMALYMFYAFKTIPTASGTKYLTADYEQSNDGETWSAVSSGVSLPGYPVNLNQMLSEDNAASRYASNNTVVKIYDYMYGTGHNGTQVLTVLQAMYGEQYKAFLVVPCGDTGIIYTNMSFLMPGTPFNSNTSLSNQNKSYSETDFGYCDNFPGTTINPDSFNFGFKYTLPEDAEGYVNKISKACAALTFEENPLDEKLIFDVYVDGTIGGKGPSIAIRCRNNNPEDSTLPISFINPHVWIWPYEDPDSHAWPGDEPVVLEDGIRVPAELIKFDNIYAFDSFALDDTYMGRVDDYTRDMDPLSKVLKYGIDGIPDYLYYYLRFDVRDENGQGAAWGDLYRVAIPYAYEGAAYIEPHMFDSSDKNKTFATEVNIIGGLPIDEPADDPDEPEPGEDPSGEPDPNGPYPPGKQRFDPEDGEPEGFSGNSILTKTYCLAALTAKNLGSKLWSQSYYDVLKVQNNPIENIVALKWFPFSSSGTDEEIRIGNVDMGVDAPPVSNMKVIPFTRSYTYKPNSERPGYLSCSPYATIKLHLPYVGTVQLDATEIMNQALSGKYVIDLITGDCLVLLTLDGYPFMNVSGKMGVDVPLTASNRVQSELASASRALSATIGAAAHVAGGDVAGAVGQIPGIMSFLGMDFSTQRTATHSPACASYENRQVFVEVYYNVTHISEGYKQAHGLPAHYYGKLIKGSGFVKIDRRARINVAMTDEENRMLEQIMTSGFYV